MTKSITLENNGYQIVNVWTRIGVRLLDIIFIGIITSIVSIGLQVLFDTRTDSKFLNSYTETIEVQIEKTNTDKVISYLFSGKIFDCDYVFQDDKALQSECDDYFESSILNTLIITIIISLITIGYFVILPLTSWRGQLFKKVFGLEIVKDDDEELDLPINFETSCRREFIDLVTVTINIISVILMYSGIIGLFNIYTSILIPVVLLAVSLADVIVLFANSRNKSLRDVLAGTIVIQKIKDKNNI